MITGEERFLFKNQDLGFSVLDFWRFAYSEIKSDPRDDIAEFLVSKALGVDEAYNRKNWTVFDILYPGDGTHLPNGYRIEVKSTGYYQTWRTDGKVSQHRAFSIRKSQDANGIVARHSDVYVFCLLNGYTSDDTNPLNVESWDFYIVATNRINSVCAENKSITLSRVKKLSQTFTYTQIKGEVDRILNIEPEQ